MSSHPSYLKEIQSQFKTSAQTKLDALTVLESKIAQAIDLDLVQISDAESEIWSILFS
jgi:hypothetical protein